MHKFEFRGSFNEFKFVIFQDNEKLHSEIFLIFSLLLTPGTLLSFIQSLFKLGQEWKYNYKFFSLLLLEVSFLQGWFCLILSWFTTW